MELFPKNHIFLNKNKMHIIVVKTPITINNYKEMKNGQNNYYKNKWKMKNEK